MSEQESLNMWNDFKSNLINRFINNRQAFLRTEDDTEEETYLHAYDMAYRTLLQEMDMYDKRDDLNYILEHKKMI
ncbi:hypothetical protein MXE62_02950 [Staphylococcus haemolyticus]|uniref:hypothetical protein n=1 Tax=Staphylococcus TaxID=1279 RepID=UPI000756CEA3|nr:MULTISPECIES: hypothetical protein [Staphylococcus]AVH47437.1 hypothetical protein CWR44_09535 [Staphylococcus haemolyticus]KAA2278082.1 hypothetical protein F1592_00740 [Staphylococcus sp. GDX7P312P]KAA2281481.1 hypothetical protein F1591_03265 [Staphylococcus sp. GDX7P459A]MCH4482903.1 hypothetical protein [Staphylococcus haemolyticus]MEB5827149.1 hypothetical protein [Staphylococcus haemolyticus]